MSERYADTVRRIRSVMDSVEVWLATLPDGSGVTTTLIQQEIRTPYILYDQATLALSALRELGVVDRESSGKLSQARLLETTAFREGIRVGLDHALGQIQSSELRVLAALPVGLPSTTQATIQQEAVDLRAALIGLVASAQEHLLLASPFWDDATIADLGDILARRLKGGIKIDLLGRSISPLGNEHGYALMVERLQSYPACRAFTWNEERSEDRFGTQTFHFKCIIADYGRKAYLGSANFTTASLRSRMELGVLFTDKEARTLSRIVSQVLTVARPCKV